MHPNIKAGSVLDTYTHDDIVLKDTFRSLSTIFPCTLKIYAHINEADCLVSRNIYTCLVIIRQWEQPL
jgi:hypothetical protein